MLAFPGMVISLLIMPALKISPDWDGRMAGQEDISMAS